MRILNFVLLSTLYVFAQDRLTGIVKPIYDGKLSVSTDGIVLKFYKKEGDIVKKGEVILKLDDKLQILETKRRKLAYDDKTQLETLEQNTLILKDILNKKETLYRDTKAVSLNDLNQLRMQYINTKGELESIRANEEKEAIEYELSAEVLEYYNLKSPISGIITKIQPKIGEWVQTGKEIVYVVDTTICFVEIDLDISMLSKIKLNSKVGVEVIISENIIKKVGSVNFISAVADTSSSLVRAKVYFDNKDMAVTPGVNASVLF